MASGTSGDFVLGTGQPVSSPGFGAGDYLAAGGEILGGIGGLISGLDEQSAFDYNAGILNEQADQVIVSEGLAKTEFGKEEERFLGTQTAKYAAAGVTQAGSPTDALLQSATNYEFDKMVMDYNAKVKAQGLQSQASNEKYYGREATNAGISKLGSSLLTAGMLFL